jgi:hypothetical protein
MGHYPGRALTYLYRWASSPGSVAAVSTPPAIQSAARQWRARLRLPGLDDRHLDSAFDDARGGRIAGETGGVMGEIGERQGARKASGSVPATVDALCYLTLYNLI